MNTPGSDEPHWIDEWIEHLIELAAADSLSAGTDLYVKLGFSAVCHPQPSLIQEDNPDPWKWN